MSAEAEDDWRRHAADELLDSEGAGGRRGNGQMQFESATSVSETSTVGAIGGSDSGSGAGRSATAGADVAAATVAAAALGGALLLRCRMRWRCRDNRLRSSAAALFVVVPGTRAGAASLAAVSLRADGCAAAVAARLVELAFCADLLGVATRGLLGW